MYSDYPAFMTHPGYAPAVLAPETKRGQPNSVGSPVRYPPVTVNNQDQQQQYEAKGYVRQGQPSARAFATATAVIPQTYGGGLEYPKYVGDTLVHTPDQELAALEAQEHARLNPPPPPPEPIGTEDAAARRLDVIEANMAQLMALMTKVVAAVPAPDDAPGPTLAAVKASRAA